VIGGGPAGASAANAMCLRDVRDVALIDRAHFPREKACGDGITGRAIDVIQALELDQILTSYPSNKKLVMIAPSGVQAAIEATDTEPPLPPFYVIPRRVFDAYLVRAAVSRGCADLTGWNLEHAERRNDRWELDLSATGSKREQRRVSADFLIGADGAMSRVRRILGLALNSDAHTAIAIRAYATSSSPLTQQLRFDLIKEIHRPGYAWMFTIASQAGNVGVASMLLSYKLQTRHLRDLLDVYASYLGEDFTLDSASALSAILPLASQLPRLAIPERSAALVGDAASMINPVNFEGISYGMAAGLLLGSLLADAMARRSSLSEAAVLYEKEFRAQFAAHFRNSFLLSKIVRPQLFVERIVRACLRNRSFFRAYINLILSGKSKMSLVRLLLDGLVSP